MKISGASMNPARSAGPAGFVSGRLSDLWIYIAGPLAGAVVATLFTHALHGPYTEAEEQAAQGED